MAVPVVSFKKIYPASYCVVISTLLMTLTSHVTMGQDVTIVRTMNVSHALNHMAVDGTGYIYLGAVNAIYKLHPVTFDQNKQIVRTGPILDGIDCEIPFDNNNCDKKMTDNYNKVLEVDTDNARLLTCGSVRQGTCQFRQLSDISSKEEFQVMREHYVAANDATSSTVAFIAPGPPTPATTKVIYTGTTATSPSHIREHVPTIASRKLTGDDALQFTSYDGFSDKGSYLKLDDHFLDYNISYIAGFHVGTFNYFITVQRKIYAADRLGEYVTMISRFCENDDALISFVEMPLECKGGSKNYNLLQAASLSNPGSILATQMQIRTTDKILIATFSEASSEGSIVPKNSTGICVYSFKDINAKFLENIQNCYSGLTHSVITKYLDVGADICIKANVVSLSFYYNFSYLNNNFWCLPYISTSYI